MDLDETYRTARHECGHALAAVLLGGSFRYVTIRPRRYRFCPWTHNLNGHVVGIRGLSPRDDAIMTIVGMVAERESAAGLGIPVGDQSDMEYLEGLVERVPDVFEVGPDSPLAEAEKLVVEYADLLDVLAARLVEKKTLAKREFLEAVAEWTRAQRVMLGV